MRFPCNTRPSWMSKHYKNPRKEPIYTTRRCPAVSSYRSRTSTSSPVIVHVERVHIEHQQRQHDHAYDRERMLKPQDTDHWDRPTRRESPASEDSPFVSLADERYPIEWQIKVGRRDSREQYIARPLNLRKDDKGLYKHDLIIEEFLDLRSRMEEKEYEDMIARQSASKDLMDQLLLTLPNSRGRHIGADKGDGRTPEQTLDGASEDRQDREIQEAPSQSMGLTVNMPSHIPVKLNVGQTNLMTTSKQQSHQCNTQGLAWKNEPSRPDRDDVPYQFVNHNTPVFNRESSSSYSRAYSPPATPRSAEYLAEDGEGLDVHYTPQWLREHGDRRRGYLIDRRGGHRYDERAREGLGEDGLRGGYEDRYDHEHGHVGGSRRTLS
ncbi:hypothetical protein BJ875DRAFT_186967 [Amylocarpus encephaloides]|uniref:Uncharacterized protein n=1 Tax=Amylocarpus encephaloides TaxID=45428 RepID=A0A9P7Y9G3_9HELO|nr:hypothetical protein BJ875DRAFT_186967 [Amylocarpus encephaloides]